MPAERWFLFLIDFFGNNNPFARELSRSFREDSFRTSKKTCFHRPFRNYFLAGASAMLPRTAFQVLRRVARSFRKSFCKHHASAKSSACFRAHSEKHISETILRDPRSYFRILVSVDKRKTKTVAQLVWTMHARDTLTLGLPIAQCRYYL